MLGIRWTIGDVGWRGFESLRLSIWGAWGNSGAGADYRFFVNTISVGHARQLVDRVPDAVRWHVVLRALPDALAAWLVDESPERCLLAEDVVPGVGQFVSVCGKRALSPGIRGLPAELSTQGG